MLDFKILCAENSGFQTGPEGEKQWWHYWYKTAECDVASGDPRRVKLTCGSLYRTFQVRRTITHLDQPDKVFYPECPENTTCQNVFLPVQGEGGPEEKTGCVKKDDLVRETVRSNPLVEDQEVHCSLSLRLPGSHYRALPGEQKINLVLTEQVRYPDGKPYPAALLYIRDTSSPKGFNRAWRQNADVASAVIELGTYRGNFVSKNFEFCMKMLPGHAISSVIFTYSFFKVDLHHGRIHAS